MTGKSQPRTGQVGLQPPLGETAQRVTTLALAWYFSGDEKYAQSNRGYPRMVLLISIMRMNQTWSMPR